MNKIDLASLRKSYTQNELLEQNVAKDPFVFFEKWFGEAVQAEVPEPNAMYLATVSDGKPHGRIVLLKGLDSEGFTFYTNYESHKGKQIAENAAAAITFFWVELERQVRVEGKIEKVSREESEMYFHSRPRGSQIGAWVSSQSQVIENREVLEQKLASFEEKFQGIELIPKPDYWGGYRLIPSSIEFWQGRPNRLHDRILYTKNENNWGISRLSP